MRATSRALRTAISAWTRLSRAKNANNVVLRKKLGTSDKRRLPLCKNRHQFTINHRKNEQLSSRAVHKIAKRIYRMRSQHVECVTTAVRYPAYRCVWGAEDFLKIHKYRRSVWDRLKKRTIMCVKLILCVHQKTLTLIYLTGHLLSALYYHEKKKSTVALLDFHHSPMPISRLDTPVKIPTNSISCTPAENSTVPLVAAKMSLAMPNLA